MCNTASIGDFVIESPALIPTCFLAAMIGFSAYSTISKANIAGSKFYSMTFFMFGTMMSIAGINDCLLPLNGDQADFIHQFFMIMDVGLTSTIGMTFGFNGLIDIGVITEGIATFTVWGFLAGLIFGLWFYTIEAMDYQGFMYLYVYVIGFACGLYCICEVIYLVKNRSTKGFVWVFVAGLTGGFGLLCVVDSSISYWFCHTFGCYFGGEFMWFVLSDVAMYANYKYFMSRVLMKATQEKGYEAFPLITINH